MQVKATNAKLIAKDGWLRCPRCGQKVLRLMPETQATALPVYCKHCKTETIVNIDLSLSHSACAT